MRWKGPVVLLAPNAFGTGYPLVKPDYDKQSLYTKTLYRLVSLVEVGSRSEG
jgi:hypothetical protein